MTAEPARSLPVAPEELDMRVESHPTLLGVLAPNEAGGKRSESHPTLLGVRPAAEEASDDLPISRLASSGLAERLARETVPPIDDDELALGATLPPSPLPKEIVDEVEAEAIIDQTEVTPPPDTMSPVHAAPHLEESPTSIDGEVGFPPASEPTRAAFEQRETSERDVSPGAMGRVESLRPGVASMSAARGENNGAFRSGPREQTPTEPPEMLDNLQGSGQPPRFTEQASFQPVRRSGGVGLVLLWVVSLAAAATAAALYITRYL